MACSVEKLHHCMNGPKIMSLPLLKEITNDFSNELGGGKYGTVYKGEQNGIEIAVKMLRFTPGIDDCEQFKREFENLKRLSHPNIVQLLGYCYEIKREYVDSGNGRYVFADCIYRALSFEFMPNGNLRQYISGEFEGLDWQIRYKIIKGVCEGLKYLHKEADIYHLDLKPENILLDKNMMPKLADFGLSRLVGSEQSRATESPVGTTGYVPPEYIEEKLISQKFDIFSLGVVMIKIMAGHESYNKKAEMSSQEFIELVRENWRKRLQKAPGCTTLEDACNQVKRCIEIASDCVRTDRKQRPEIGTIIHRLNETEDMTQEMVLCLPHESRTDQTRHIEKQMDMSTAPSPIRLLGSTSNSGVVLSQLQELQHGDVDEDKGQPAEAGGKSQKDGSCSNAGGSKSTKLKMVLHPTPQQHQKEQVQMNKGLKLPPELKFTLPEDEGSEIDDEDLDDDELEHEDSEDEASEFDGDMDDDYYDGPETVMAPMRVDRGDKNGGVGMMRPNIRSLGIPGMGQIGGNGMPQQQVGMTLRPTIRSPGISRMGQISMPSQQAGMMRPYIRSPGIPAGLGQIGRISMPPLPPQQVSMPLPPQQVSMMRPPSIVGGNIFGGASFPGMEQKVVMPPPPQQLSLMRPTNTMDNAGYPRTGQMGSTPLSHSGHLPIGSMQAAGFYQGGVSGMEKLQSAVTTANLIAPQQQQTMALIQRQEQQQQLILNDDAHGHGGATRRRSCSCVISFFCCA